MSDLSDLLSKRQMPQEPETFPIVRSFIEQHLQITPGLQLRDGAIMISVPSSAAAGALRFQLPALRRQLPPNTELVIVRS